MHNDGNYHENLNNIASQQTKEELFFAFCQLMGQLSRKIFVISRIIYTRKPGQLKIQRKNVFVYRMMYTCMFQGLKGRGEETQRKRKKVCNLISLVRFNEYEKNMFKGK